MAKTWTPEAIREKLATCDIMVERSILKLYEMQTEAEKVTERTTEHNGVGFNGVDAEIMSSFAQQLLRQKNSVRPEGRRLSDKQRVLARKKLKKYARQLAGFANKTPTAVQLSLPAAA
jgi:hypothetical protein